MWKGRINQVVLKEKDATDSEKEWLLLMVKKCCLEEEQKAEKDFQWLLEESKRVFLVLHKLSSRGFTSIREEGSKTFKTKNLLFFYRIDQNRCVENTVHYGLTVTKKKVRRAVYRNRIKRLLREGFRKSETLKNVNGSLKVNVVYAPKSDTSSILCYNDIHREVEQFFTKLS